MTVTLGAERDQHRRQVHVRIGMREVPPMVATLRTRTLDSVSSVRVMTGACARTVGGALHDRKRRHRADAQRAVRRGLDRGQLLDACAG